METNPTSIHDDVGLIPCLAQWVTDPALLWSVVEASSCSSDSTPSLGTSICCRSGTKKTKQNKTKNQHKNQTNKTMLKKYICEGKAITIVYALLWIRQHSLHNRLKSFSCEVLRFFLHRLLLLKKKKSLKVLSISIILICKTKTCSIKWSGLVMSFIKPILNPLCRPRKKICFRVSL